jgi:heme exporter protein D
MNIQNLIALYDAEGGYAVTVISIAVAFGLIAILLYYVRQSKKRKNMVKNKKKPNDTPSEQKDV